MQRRVMLWGIEGDPPLDAVRREFARDGVPYVMVDQRDMAGVEFNVDSVAPLTGRLTLDGDVIPLDDIGAIMLRPYNLRDVLAESPDAAPDAAAHRAALELTQHLMAWMDIADALVINRPSAMHSNNSKPYQAELIREFGFSIPTTLVTTTPDAAREFIACHQTVMYKSVSGARSMASRVGEEELRHLDDVRNCPTQFQAYIAGTDWRVHVVGDDVFACEIRCTADDYRTAEMQGIAVDVRTAQLPESVAQRCHDMAHGLNLPLAGIDLRRTDDDAWYCFEVNPAPAFTYYEQRTRQPLSAAVACLLTEWRHDSRTQPMDVR